jgi:hypothetical protein
MQNDAVSGKTFETQELEDMVGKLLEQEEDLFQEIEDQNAN